MSPYPELTPHWRTCAAVGVVILLAYLVRLNWLLSHAPDAVAQLAPKRWTAEEILAMQARLRNRPVTTASYAAQIPPRLARRYVVTGGSGLVGGFIVLQLLERGTPPEAIRIVDFHKPQRADLLRGAGARVGYVWADISSRASTDAAFAEPWDPSITHLPITVFHTAAVIIPSDRSKLEYAFCEAVNVQGTQHVLDAARQAGADVLVSTTSGSISIRPVKLWMAPWRMWSGWPVNYAQLLDETDFFQPLRSHGEFYANYPVAKATAERIVCGANSATLRTGCIRPANGVYGNPTDNTVGGPLNMGIYPEWTDHIVQSFVHGINAAIAHLQLEAVLAQPESWTAPQAGRPFTVTDPNPPITYQDLYFLIATLAITPFRTVPLWPIPMVIISYLIEWYSLTRLRFPVLRKLLPAIPGDVQHLKPAIFSITTHLYATSAAAHRSVQDGGLGYRGVVTTLEGMTQEVMEWNDEHRGNDRPKKTYKSSVSLAQDMQRLADMASATMPGRKMKRNRIDSLLVPSEGRVR